MSKFKENISIHTSYNYQRVYVVSPLNASHTPSPLLVVAIIRNILKIVECKGWSSEFFFFIAKK